MLTSIRHTRPTAMPYPPAKRTGLPDSNPCPELSRAALEGDIEKIERFVYHGANINQQYQRLNGFTPLVVAAVAGQLLAVQTLLSLNADPNIRDNDGYKIIKLALDANQTEVVHFLITQGVPVTDPRVGQGKSWLREQYKTIGQSVKDEDSKPPQAVFDYLVKGYLHGLFPEKRSVSEIYWEHILLQFIGDNPLDVERNFSKDLILPHSGTYDRILSGHEGIREAGRLLFKELPTTKYTIKGTYVDREFGWVTERWGYIDTQHNLQVEDGIDTFLINEETGKIEVMMINFNVKPIRC